MLLKQHWWNVIEITWTQIPLELVFCGQCYRLHDGKKGLPTEQDIYVSGFKQGGMTEENFTGT